MLVHLFRYVFADIAHAMLLPARFIAFRLIAATLLDCCQPLMRLPRRIFFMLFRCYEPHQTIGSSPMPSLILSFFVCYALRRYATYTENE